jgi:type II secretory pathway pseudopilin PulG
MPRKVKAFSLLELGLVLLIMGVIGSQLVPMIKKTLILKKHEITKRNQEIIFQSVADYAKRQSRLPFASRPTLKGAEQANLTIGIVPYQTLGLEERSAKDGFGHYMTYAMNSTLGKTNSISNQSDTDNSLCYSENRTISTLLTLTNQTIPTSDFIAIILVAHHNGEGAYMINNNRSTFKQLSTNTSHCRAQNITDSGLFCAEYSEDTISWQTRNNFLSSYVHANCPTINTQSNFENPSTSSFATFYRQ